MASNMTEYFQQRLCEKLHKELKLYKQNMMTLKAEQVFRRAYEIDTYISIYENLLLKVQNTFTETQMQRLLTLPDVLGFFYAEWLDCEDSREQELNDSIDKAIQMEWLNVAG